MKREIKIDLGDAVFWLMVLLCAVLFSGTPDIADAIIYKLTDGKSELPAYKEEK